MLMSLVISHLGDTVPMSEAFVLYLYCDYRLEEEQNLSHFLAVLLKQLSIAESSTLDRISKLYVQHHAKRTKPSEAQLRKTLLEVTGSLKGLFVVVDALDECMRHVRKELVAFIREMQGKCRVKFMVSSRSIPEISALFRDDRCLPIRGANPDIHTYVSSRTDELSPAVNEVDGLSQLVVERIVGASDGVFLLARLYVDSLLDAVTAQDVEFTLTNFATKEDVKSGKAYDLAYRAALARVFRNRGRKMQLARAAFAWVTFAKRPLTKHELQHALAVEINSTALDLPNVDFVLGFCAGLLVPAGHKRGDYQARDITLVHETLKEYLVRRHSDWHPRVLYDIAATSMKYLSLRFDNPDSSDERRFSARQLAYLDHMDPPEEYIGVEAGQWRLLGAALGEYGLTWWLRHVQDAIRAQVSQSEAQTLQQIAGVLFATGGPFSIRRNWYVFWETPFHVVVRRNLPLFWNEALASGADPGETDSDGRAPLSYAAEAGRAAMVERLLQLPSVDPSHRDVQTWYTALHHAVFQKHTYLVRRLAPLTDVDAVDQEGKTLLEHIFDARDWKTGRELFPHVDAGAVLKLAVTRAHNSIVELLDQEGYRSKLIRSKIVDWKFLFESALRIGSKRIVNHLLSILQSAPDLCNDSIKGVYAEYRAQSTYEATIRAHPEFQRCYQAQVLEASVLSGFLILGPS